MGTNEGLLFGLHASDAGDVRGLGWDDLDATGGDGFVWLHLDADAPRAIAWVREHSGIDPIAQDALLAQETRPRAIVRDDRMLLLLRAVNLNPGQEPDDMIALRMHVTPGRLVTLRRRPVRTVEAVREAVEARRVRPAPGALLVAICDQLTQYVGEVVEDVEDRSDAFEEEILSAESHDLRSRISDLRRTMIALRRYLAPQREALTRVAGAAVPWLDDRERGRLREITDRAVRHVEELDEGREHAGVAYEELTGRLTERLESRMYVLSLVAAIFLPLGFVTGLLGINVGGIPGAETPSAFLWVLGSCVALAVGMLLVLRRRGWF